MLVCNDLVKKYYSCTAVDNLSMTIESGKIYALLGPNGSGKTTLMKMIMGLIKPTSGSITLDGELISDSTKADVTYMPTENYFYPYMKIKDVVKFYNDFYEDFNEERFNVMLDRMDLHFTDKTKNMSTGMLAKLKVAVAMARDSKIIMLDEPLNGIDIIAREAVVQTMKEFAGGNKTVIVSSHLVDDLDAVVDGAVFMKKGKLVVAGDADKIRTSNNMNLVELYKAVYGVGGLDNVKID